MKIKMQTTILMSARLARRRKIQKKKKRSKETHFPTKRVVPTEVYDI